MKVKLNKSQYNYLRENNILDAYKRNFKNYHEEDEDYDYSESDYFITYSFIWDNTKEGYNFWNEHGNKSKGLRSNELEIIEV